MTLFMNFDIIIQFRFFIIFPLNRSIFFSLFFLLSAKLSLSLPFFFYSFFIVFNYNTSNYVKDSTKLRLKWVIKRTMAELVAV